LRIRVEITPDQRRQAHRIEEALDSAWRSASSRPCARRANGSP